MMVLMVPIRSSSPEELRVMALMVRMRSSPEELRVMALMVRMRQGEDSELVETAGREVGRKGMAAGLAALPQHDGPRCAAKHFHTYGMATGLGDFFKKCRTNVCSECRARVQRMQRFASKTCSGYHMLWPGGGPGGRPGGPGEEPKGQGGGHEGHTGKNPRARREARRTGDQGKRTKGPRGQEAMRAKGPKDQEDQGAGLVNQQFAYIYIYI